MKINMKAQLLEEKIIDLEIRLCHQDDLLESLNEVVVTQQQQIALMEKQIKHVGSQMKSIRQATAGPEEDEAPPPHY